MLKVFPVFRVSLPNLFGDKERFFFTNKEDADWFASYFDDLILDVINEVSLTDCTSDVEKDSFINLIRYGTGTFDK